MGASSSLPQQLFAAVRAGSVPDVQAALQQLRRSSAPDARRKELFSWVDPASGQTCLMLAASRNMLEVMRLLLAEGADPHVMSARARGSALHEAVAGKHDAAAELLLQYRADPFLENAKGETAMDLAVLSGSVKLVRRLERCALFSGMVNQKVLQLRGFSSANKDRWAVVMPRFLPPKPGQAVGVVRMVLWVYRDAAGVEPRTKVWLDGATAYKIGPEDGVVRLHPNHEQPKNASTKYDRGWLLFFRPAAAAASPAGAREAFNRLIDCCARPLDYLAAASAGAGAAPAAPPPQWPPQQQQQQEQQQQQQQQQQQPSAVGYPPPGLSLGAAPPAAAAAYPPISPYPPGSPQAAAQPPHYPPLSAPAGTAGQLQAVRPAEAPPAFVLSDHPALQVHAGGAGGRTSSASAGAGPGSTGSSPRRQQQQQEYDPLVARPGESDEEFAQRLSRMYGSYEAALPPAAAAAAAAAQQQQEQQLAAASPPPAADADAAPSAPPAVAGPQAAGAAATAAGADPADEENMCIICMTNERQIGFLHGSSVHRCVCRECAALVRIGGPCPLCRAPITAVLNVY